MISTLLALVSLVAPDGVTAGSNQAASNQTSATAASATQKVNRFAGRPQARIAFSRDIRNFQIKRDGRDDVLYLETRRDRWFRSEIHCFGIDDPTDAQGLIPLDHAFGFERSSRIGLVSFGHRTNECSLDGLVELTRDEAVEFRLVRRAASPEPARPTAPPS